MKDRFYHPQIHDIKLQDKRNHQGRSDEQVEEVTAQGFLDTLDHIEKDSYAAYEDAIESGISREMARMLLPVNVYTEWYWTCDLRNIAHFLGLRAEKHAQQEVQEFAWAMYSLVKKVAPWTMEAFVDYKMEALSLSRLDQESIKVRSTKLLGSNNQRENEEYETKLKKMGLYEEFQRIEQEKLLGENCHDCIASLD
jgi:thymidylate synthase (FAD)